MATVDVTVKILTAIRDEIRKTNGEIRKTNEEIRKTNLQVAQLSAEVVKTNSRLDEMREELSRRIVESEVRTATAIDEVAGSISDLTALLRSQHDLRPRVNQCEQDIAQIKSRLQMG